MTKKELKTKVEALGEISDDQRNNIICSLIGHSKICTGFMGYRYCGRCGDQLGDSLASIDPGATEAVYVGHKCEKCEVNWKKCTWKDKLYCKDPFAVDSPIDDEYDELPYLEVL